MTVTPPLQKPAGGKGSPAPKENKTKRQLNQAVLETPLCCKLLFSKK